MSIRVYGLKNCDSCRKARRWLEGQGADYSFLEVRDPALRQTDIADWIRQLGTTQLVNRRSTTWRSLDDDQKALAGQPETAAGLLDANRSLLKRPIIEVGGQIRCGFDTQDWSALLQGATADG